MGPKNPILIIKAPKVPRVLASSVDPAKTKEVPIIELARTRGTLGALIFSIGFWGPLYYNYNKEPTQNSIGKLLQVIKALIQNSL